MSLSKLNKSSLRLRDRILLGRNFGCRLPAITGAQIKRFQSSLLEDNQWTADLNFIQKSVRTLTKKVLKDCEYLAKCNNQDATITRSKQQQDRSRHHHHHLCARNALVQHEPSRIQDVGEIISSTISKEFANSKFGRIFQSALYNHQFQPPTQSSIYGLPGQARGIHTSACNCQDEKQQKNDDKDPKKENEDKMMSFMVKIFVWMTMAYIFIATIALLFPSSNQPDIMRWVSWNEFMFHMLAKGEVEEIIVRPENEIVTIILHDGAIIKGRRTEHRAYHMNIGEIGKFETKLRQAEERLGISAENRLPVIYARSQDSASKLITSLIIALVVFSLLMKTKAFKMNMSMDSFLNVGKAKFTLVDSKTPGKGVRFDDVAGLKEPKQEVREFVDYLKRPDFYKSLGAKVPKGALLLGPPGCGKTMLAKAVATEAGVPFLSMNGSEFIEMIGGLGAARVRDLFKEAKKRRPCIIYIDEIDAIGKQRSGSSGSADGGSGESEQTLNQLLVEMDGMVSKEGVLMLASTNRADVLDKALLRPGRFDRHILIDLPTIEERREIFEHHMKCIKLDFTPSKYSRRMAQLTPGFSGADIANVCNEAALHAARENKKTVMRSDFDYSIDRVVGGIEKRTKIMSPEERTVVAYHECGHAIVAWMLETTDALLKVTIVPRTNHALGFAQYLPSDKRNFSREELFERMCMALGGRVAESLNFNRVTTGAQNDLERVTKMAYAQVRHFGMSDKVGLLSFDEQETSTSAKKPYSRTLGSLMDDEVRRIVYEAYKKTEEVLTANKDKLEALAKELLKKETLSYKEVEAIIGPPKYGAKKLIMPEEFENEVENAPEMPAPDPSPMPDPPPPEPPSGAPPPLA